MADYDILDGLQQAIIVDEQKKQANQKKIYKFDKLSLFFMEDYNVKGINISQPTIGDILKVGESNFYQALSPFLYNSTSIRVMLWDAGIDWCEIRDIEVFSMLLNMRKQEYQQSKLTVSDEGDKIQNSTDPLKILFKDIDIYSFDLYNVKQTENSEEELCLYSKQYDIKLYEDDYMEIAEYIREMLNAHPKVEKGKGKTAKKWMIDEDRMNLLHKDNQNTSTLLPLISSCVNHPGFKYKLQELKEVGIYQFMDSVQRLQIYETSRALLQGSYSGFCDTSKIQSENFNFMREII